ncbi:MAG: PsbP-related protein [Actinomycetota bacterium]
MICPECGTYQPDRAKFCGMCGVPLSQESLVENFLRQGPEEDLILPRHRSPWFYLAVFLILCATLAALAGAVFLVYREVSGKNEGSETVKETVEGSADYFDPDLGYGLSYPQGWTLEQGFAAQDELSSLRVRLTSRKFMEVKVQAIDPVVAVGGLEALREDLQEKVGEQVRSLGGSFEDPEAMLLSYTRAGGMPAFYLEFEANLMGESTSFLLCYVVGGNYCFRCEGRAPREEYRSVRPLFWSIIESVHAGEEVPQ